MQGDKQTVIYTIECAIWNETHSAKNGFEFH
jgi:hypothetical protein